VVVTERLNGQYEIVREIGRGGQAVTFLATDADGRELALKQLSLRGADSWKAVELFEREAQVLRNLSHDAIPAYVDSFHIENEAGTSFYLAQELVEGETLQSMWDRDEFAPVLTQRQTLRLIREVAEILVYLHSLNPPVVHRDIKPANLFRRPDGSFALVDFGAVQALVPGTMGGSTFVGTSGYMAPEQLMGRACPASDIFALGATAVHMLSGFHPGDLPVRRMRMDFDGVLSASDAVTALLERMVDPDVGTRFSSAEDLLRAVRHLEPAEQSGGEMVSWDSFRQWPQVTLDDAEVEMRFPISITNSAASVGMFAGWAAVFLSFAVFANFGVVAGAIVLSIMFVIASAATMFALSRAHLRLDPERFEAGLEGSDVMARVGTRPALLRDISEVRIGIRHIRDASAQIFGQHLLLRSISGHLAEDVEVVPGIDEAHLHTLIAKRARHEIHGDHLTEVADVDHPRGRNARSHDVDVGVRMLVDRAPRRDVGPM